jgi:F-type H+-transporting ATPase subunit b
MSLFRQLSGICVLGLISCCFIPAVLGQQEHAPEVERLRPEAEEHTDHLTQWKIVNFALLAVILGWAMAKYGGPFFASRTREIQKDIAKAGRQKQDAETHYAVIEQRLARLDDEVEELRQSSRREAAAESERIKQETAQLLQKIQAQAEQEIATAAKTARLELRSYAADLTVRLAEEKVRRQLTPETDAVSVQAFVKGLQSGQYGRRLG